MVAFCAAEKLAALRGCVAPSLRKLQLRGYRLGIASNFDGRLTKSFAKTSSLRMQANLRFVGHRLYKARFAFFRAVEERLGAQPDQIALVGDDEISDVEGATAAGWRAIRLDRSGQCSAAGTIHSLAELL